MKANYKKIHKLCYQENVLISIMNNLPEYDISDGFLVSFDKSIHGKCSYFSLPGRGILVIVLSFVYLDAWKFGRKKKWEWFLDFV
ncbi:unnamed protein product [Rhizophagus irregularis]|uniref:Uncharacterized protein n=1 Tax=Rhizophagus irregularis TaxID=588596 RepID=A0A915Z487_9GLOM|nr:unnamed protein product [Rhizophagus irregularis]